MPFHFDTASGIQPKSEWRNVWLLATEFEVTEQKKVVTD
jgi:hypothetical protein